MTTHLRNFMALVIFAYLFLSSAHAGNKAEILGDSKLASIRGGYCLFFKCQGPPGNGECQPIGNDAYDLCQHISCSFTDEMEGNTEVLECQVKGESPKTCSEATTYIQCVRASSPSICVPDNNSTVCGTLTNTYCFPDVRDRQCFCDTGGGALPCDWVSCVY